MRLKERTRLDLAAALLSVSMCAAGCGDEEDAAQRDADVSPAAEDDAGTDDGGVDSSDGPATDSPSDAASSTTSDAAASDAAPLDPPSDAGALPGDASSAAPSEFPTLPEVLSLSGCAELDVPPLCSVAQSAGSFTANCAGQIYSGTVAKDRTVQLSGPESASDGENSHLTCTGRLEVAGFVALDCTRTTAGGVDAGAPQTATCKMRSERQVLPGIGCMELPQYVEDLTVCSEGAAAGGTTLAAGRCKVIQHGCAFQAECANELTLTGTVSRTGLRFTQRLKALADAATPANGGSPAFMKGAEANHTCTATLTEGKVSGSCTAGNVRGVPATSVCGLGGAFAAPASCGLIGPSAEQLFVLDSCDALKSGEGQNPGIGEPVCAVRQNNCVWDIQCGRDPLTKFSGRLTPGARKIEWRLATGTPCELTIDAGGQVSGKCTVPGQPACELKSKAAQPGGASCPVLPGGTRVKSHGCGGGDPLMCRATLQHQCEYMALCEFTANNDLLVAGRTSLDQGRERFEFNGLGEYSCSVHKASAAEVASGDRLPYEWYGQCTTPEGGMCRDNYDPQTKSGFRGLRLYFDVPEGVTVPPPPAMSAVSL